MKTPYTFSVLRYVHDAVTQEFVNIGVVLFAPEQWFLKARFSDKYSRITKMFEKVDGRYYRELVRYVESRICEVGEKEILLLAMKDAESLPALLNQFLPSDDSSIQFSAPGAGLGMSLDEELESLFERYVTKYASGGEVEKKTDKKVWNVFKKELEKREVGAKLQSHKIVAPNFDYEFKHAAKNGIWHVCEAISFDMVEEHAISDKANVWVGRFTNLRKSSEQFKVNFLLGRPEDPQMEERYSRAKKILAEMPEQNRLFEEEQAEEFADAFQRDVLGDS